MSLAEALTTGDVSRLPSRREEDWRWSDLRGLVRVAPPPSPAWEGDLPPGPFAALAAEVLQVVNGRGPDRLEVAPGEIRTVALRFISAPNAAGHLNRMQVDIGAGGSLTLLESHEGLGQGYMAATDLDITLGDNARLERIIAASDNESGVAVTIAKVGLGGQARFSQTVLTNGARRQRLETRVAHPGRQTIARLDGVYALTARRHADITTSVTHEGAGGATDQLIKGVASGHARSVFQGRIIVREGADQTDARMGHHALALSDTAEVDAKPELEIYADDVACNHGNTFGSLDAEALFYAQQRGLNENQAKVLLTRAFLNAVVDRIDHEGARAFAQDWVVARLEAPQ